MAANKKPGLATREFSFNARIVVARVAADMGHVNGHCFTVPGSVARQLGTNPIAIDIAEDAPQRLKRF